MRRGKVVKTRKRECPFLRSPRWCQRRSCSKTANKVRFKIEFRVQTKCDCWPSGFQIDVRGTLFPPLRWTVVTPVFFGVYLNEEVRLKNVYTSGETIALGHSYFFEMERPEIGSLWRGTKTQIRCGMIWSTRNQCVYSIKTCRRKQKVRAKQKWFLYVKIIWTWRRQLAEEIERRRKSAIKHELEVIRSTTFKLLLFSINSIAPLRQIDYFSHYHVSLPDVCQFLFFPLWLLRFVLRGETSRVSHIESRAKVSTVESVVLTKINVGRGSYCRCRAATKPTARENVPNGSDSIRLGSALPLKNPYLANRF